MAEKKNPWGRASSSGGNTGGSGVGGGNKNSGPDFDQMVRDFHQKFMNMLGSDEPKRALIALAGIVGVFWMATGIYLVNSDELGVVMRF